MENEVATSALMPNPSPPIVLIDHPRVHLVASSLSLLTQALIKNIQSLTFTPTPSTFVLATHWFPLLFILQWMPSSTIFKAHALSWMNLITLHGLLAFVIFFTCMVISPSSQMTLCYYRILNLSGSFKKKISLMDAQHWWANTTYMSFQGYLGWMGFHSIQVQYLSQGGCLWEIITSDTSLTQTSRFLCIHSPIGELSAI